jgi:hypothetical protein
MTHRYELDAEIARRTIREECGTDSCGFGGDRDQLAFRTGQLFVALILARRGHISLDALELAGVDRMVTPAEIMRCILRPLIARGFCRVSRGEVVASVGLATHRNPVEALMAGESLTETGSVRRVAAEKVRIGDYVLGVGTVASAPTRRTYDCEVMLREDGHYLTTHISGYVTVARIAA